MYVVVRKLDARSYETASYFNDGFPQGLNRAMSMAEALLMTAGTDGYHIVWNSGMSRDEINIALERWRKVQGS